MEFVSWDNEIPNIWKVIKFHGSKPPNQVHHFFRFLMAANSGIPSPVKSSKETVDESSLAGQGSKWTRDDKGKTQLLVSLQIGWKILPESRKALYSLVKAREVQKSW